ncbi:cell division ATP-binding protein FtsE [Jannaschia sp. W003]|uniref:cell division ATP-binding protein FtsE n=1 Tax=Jannaschia sp. W003 TaxID=2867012 RepID=UPI0021A3104A|nr:ATP-binding cassette domain-containing protein [Jannaschia sp. W003]UWQ22590.1 ATP-binding cassette domain-containing protein [Jannaschia sp. W003]
MIELKQAGYSYGRGALLREVDLLLAPGSFHFLTGPSGAGKTTLMKMLYGELKPTEGEALLFGTDSRRIDRDRLARIRRRVGVVHQDCRFLDHLSMDENVGLPLRVAGQDPASLRADLDQLLGWVGLGHRTDARPPELSGGERQRAALARAVIMDPDVILADEPTGNVDWEMSQRLLTLLAELNRMGKAVMVATHDLGLIRAAKGMVQARVLRLAGGRLTVAGADL